MVSKNLVRFAGLEVINVERLADYIDNGIAPADQTVLTVPGVIAGLAAAVDGNDNPQPYTTPIGDKAPWYDVDNPDSWDFAGLLPLDLTGLDATTRTVEVTPTLRGGGIAGKAQRGPRTVGASGMLVGRTSEAVEYGLAWLTGVLTGVCNLTDCDNGTTLEVLASATGPLVPTADVDAVPVTVITLAPQLSPTDDAWTVTEGAWLHVDTRVIGNGIRVVRGTIIAPYDMAPRYLGGQSPTSYSDQFTGGDALTGGQVRTQHADTNDAGGANPIGQAIVAAGDLLDCTDGKVTITWNLRAPSRHIPGVRMIVVDDGGLIRQYGPVLDLSTATTDYADFTWVAPFGIDVDRWRPALLVDDAALAVHNLTVSHQPDELPSACIQQYRRLFPRTSTIAGPSPTNSIKAGCVILQLVEWTWVVGTPYRYSLPNQVLAGLTIVPTTQAPATPTAVYADPAVTVGTRISQTSTASGYPTTILGTQWNCLPPTDQASCALDPSAPGFTTPPALPTVADPSRASIGNSAVREFYATFGPPLTPPQDGVLTLRLSASSKPIVGARVRVYDTGVDGAGTVTDPCVFAYEYLVDYIPAGGTLTIDGAAETITTVCAGSSIANDATGTVRGNYGGPTRTPVVRCDRRYLIEVMWLDKYPRAGGQTYTNGASEGALSLDLSITIREG